MRCAVLGDPIDHSLSPVIHGAAYRALGLEGWRYDAVQVAERWPGRLPRGAGPGRVARAVADHAAQAGGGPAPRLARRVGGRHRWVQHGAAGAGRHPARPQHRRHRRPHGAQRARRTPRARGGAGRGSDGHLGAAGPGRARDAHGHARGPRPRPRRRHRARGGGAPVRARGGRASSWTGVGRAARGDVLVSTVPASAQVPGLLAAVADIPLVFEVVYEPWPTPLAAAAERSGRTVLTGLDLLRGPGGQPGGRR